MRGDGGDGQHADDDGEGSDGYFHNGRASDTIIANCVESPENLRPRDSVPVARYFCYKSCVKKWIVRFHVSLALSAFVAAGRIVMVDDAVGILVIPVERFLRNGEVGIGMV